MQAIVSDAIQKWSCHIKQKPLIIGLQGPQGVGKSSLLSKLESERIAIMSLDDFYLCNADQVKLADESRNPLLKYRGNPGTHDLPLLESCLQNLTKQTGCVRIPRYSKQLNQGRGDRLPVSEWKQYILPLDIVLIEGWCWGFAPESHQTIHTRRLQNELLQKYSIQHLNQVNDNLKVYTDVYSMVEKWIQIETNDLSNIYDWRWQQEQGNPDNSRLSNSQVVDFVDRFMPAYHLFSLPSPDLKIIVDKERKVKETIVK